MRRLLVTALLLGGLAAFGPTAAPAQAAPVDERDQPDRAARHDLSGDAVGPLAVSRLLRWRPRPWPGSTIRYHETIPAKWDWSLDQAVRHWNESGGGIRFVETRRAKARLSIGYGDTGGADGVGTLGYQHRNYVHLSPAYKRADEHDPATRVWVGRLFTHELGHVLGFNHTRGQCSLMYPVYDFGLCPPLPDAAPGYYNCRWIDRPLLRRFVSIYGGSARQSPRLCLIEALPEPLRDVRFEGGAAADAPVRITWRKPSRVRDGTKAWVTVWHASSCTEDPDTWERRDGVQPGAGSWTDPGRGQGSWCYQLQIANRYGATRPAEVQRIARWAPVPDAPDPGAPTWMAAEGAWRFTWTAPAGTDLGVVRNWDDPGTCPTSTDDWSGLERRGSDRWVLYAGAPDECVLLVVATDWGTVSAGTPVQLSVPGAGEPPDLGAPSWVPAEGSFRIGWTPPDELTHLELVRPADGSATCPTAYDEDLAEWPWEDGTGSWLVSAYQARQCVTFFAVTTWGSVSPGRSVQLQVPPPAVTPTVGSVSYDAESGSATAQATLAGDQYRLGVEVLQGACPAQPPTDATWWDGSEFPAGTWTFYPEPWGEPGPQCVLFAAIDGFDQPGPVVARGFTVPG